MTKNSKDLKVPPTAISGSRKEEILHSFKKAGIKSNNMTKAKRGQTSVMFTNSLSPEFKDKAETVLHYTNQRKKDNKEKK
jgi:hypothetical protein